MKSIIILLSLFSLIQISYSQQQIYSQNCVWWLSSTKGNDSTTCNNYNTPCLTLNGAFNRLLEPSNSNTSACPINVTRVVYVLPDGVYKGPLNVGIRLTGNWKDGRQENNYRILIQSADPIIDTTNITYPLPIAQSSPVFDGESSNNLIQFGDIAPLTIIRGLTFENGVDLSTEFSEGAPVYVTSLSNSINFEYCNFFNNLGMVAGALFLEPKHKVNITNCRFENNRIDIVNGVDSGAITFKQSALVSGCSFTNNTGVNGGAISIYSNVRVVDTNFIKNIGKLGGGVYISNVVIAFLVGNYWTNNSFIKNYAQFGGAIYDFDSAADYRQTTFDGNVANVSGGAVAFYGSISSFQFSKFLNNVAKNGGAVWAYQEERTERQSIIADSSFTNNTASLGGAMYCYNATARFNVNNTFSSNLASTNKDYNIDYCSQTCLTASRDCGCISGCGLPPPPVTVVTDKRETRIAIGVFLPVTAILLGIVGFLLWKTNQKSKIRANADKYDEIRLTPTSHDNNIEQEQL